MSKYLTPSRHYIRIPNELIADRTLPEMVRVLYCIMAYLLSIPGFVITIGALRKYTGKSAATMSAALSVLRKHGYLRQYRSCCSGKWVWAYVLFSEPQNDGLNAIQQTRQLPSSKYVAPKSGYTKVSGSFIRRKDIHPTSKMVYLFLAAHAGKPGFSLHTWAIAEVLGHSEQTIQRHIRKLSEQGYVNATQTRDSNGRMGAMAYTIYSSSVNGSAGDVSTGDASAGDVLAVESSKPLNQSNTLTEERIEVSQALQGCPAEVTEACDWIPNRYSNLEEQHIYDVVISCIGKLYLGNNDVRKFVCEHLSTEDLTICEIADRTTEICIERILHSKKDAVAIANRGGYITEVCKDYILHWADKQQEFESI